MCPRRWSGSPACRQALLQARWSPAPGFLALRSARPCVLGAQESLLPSHPHGPPPGSAASAPLAPFSASSQRSQARGAFQLCTSIGSLAKPRNFSYGSLYFLGLS